MIKFVTQNEFLHGAQDREHRFRYVLFPYKYDAFVTTAFGTHDVVTTIELMRLAYETP